MLRATFRRKEPRQSEGSGTFVRHGRVRIIGGQNREELGNDITGVVLSEGQRVPAEIEVRTRTSSSIPTGRDCRSRETCSNFSRAASSPEIASSLNSAESMPRTPSGRRSCLVSR